MTNLITSLHTAFSSWRTKLASLVLVGTLALFCVAAASSPQSERGDGATQMPALEGSWLITVNVGQTPFPSILTFGTGGALVATDSSQAPAVGNVYQGTWTRTGPHEVTFTLLGFLFSGTGALENYIRIHETGRLDGSGQTYDSVTSTVEILDLDKNVLVSFPGATHGERIMAK